MQFFRRFSTQVYVPLFVLAAALPLCQSRLLADQTNTPPSASATTAPAPPTPGSVSADSANTQANTNVGAPIPTSATLPVATAAKPPSPSMPVFAPPARVTLPAHGWIIDGGIDTRYRDASSGRTDTAYLNESELDIGHPIYWKNQYQGNVFAQIIAENVPDRSGSRGRYEGIALGEAYVAYRLPIQTQTGSTAYLQVGQFVLPVGLLPVYDTHLQVLQTLAPLGIGERVDWGAEVQGRFNGIIDYRFAMTAGTGADRIYSDPNRVLSFRLGRLFATKNGVVNFGGSLMSGRLPVTAVDPVTGFAPLLPPSGKFTPQFGYVNKTRLVGDATWNYRASTLRGEAMSGSDGTITVDGYFAMAEYRFAPGLSAILARNYWYYGQASSTSTDNAIGMNVTYSNNMVVRFLYEDRRDVPYINRPQLEPIPATHRRYIFTVQTLLRF